MNDIAVDDEPFALEDIGDALRAALAEAGAEDVLVKGFNCLSIDPERLDCDSYRFLAGDPQAVNAYRHDYLPNYCWAEFSVGVLETQL